MAQKWLKINKKYENNPWLKSSTKSQRTGRIFQYLKLPVQAFRKWLQTRKI